MKYRYINESRWLCWQSEANPSLPCNLGNCRVIWPNCRDNAFTFQQKTPCISVVWLGFSLIRGAGRPKFLAGKVELESPASFFEINSRVINGHPIATRDVCFTPNSGHARRPNQCPLSANSGRCIGAPCQGGRAKSLVPNGAVLSGAKSVPLVLVPERIRKSRSIARRQSSCSFVVSLRGQGLLVRSRDPSWSVVPAAPLQRGFLSVSRMRSRVCRTC